MPETTAIANTALCLWVPTKTWSARLLPPPHGSSHPDLSPRTFQVDIPSACLLSCFSLFNTREAPTEQTEQQGINIDRHGLLSLTLNSPMGKDCSFLYAWWRASCMLFRGDNFTPNRWERADQLLPGSNLRGTVRFGFCPWAVPGTVLMVRCTDDYRPALECVHGV